MAIQDTWWGFLFVILVLVIVFAFALIQEWRKSDTHKGDILLIQPWKVVLTIWANQVCFYFIFLWIVFSIDIASAEAIDHIYSQIWNAYDYDFYTQRGYINVCGQTVAMWSTFVVFAALVRKHKECYDYAFTLAFNHFIIVSLATLDFPASWGWWLSFVVGWAGLWSLSEFVLYKFETMEYKANLFDRKKEVARLDKKERKMLEKRQSVVADMSSFKLGTFNDFESKPNIYDGDGDDASEDLETKSAKPRIDKSLPAAPQPN